MTRWHLKGEPRMAQMEAMRRASSHDKWGHFLDTGLGKTEVALHEFIDSGLDQHFLVVPNRLKKAWREAIEEWCPLLLPGVTIWPEEPHSGTVTFIINYEAVIYGRSFKICEKFISRTQTFMTIDEGHRIKGVSGIISRMTHSLANLPNIAMRRELTATPMTNNVLDWWSQLRFLGAIRGVNPIVFKNQYAITGGFMGKQIIGINENRISEFQAILSSCSFMASKDDWSDLPRRIQMPPSEFEMTTKQKTIYKQMFNEFLIIIQDEMVIAEMVITQVMKLQQISRGFAIDESGVARDIPGENPALKTLKDMLQDIPGKVIIFCHYKHSITTVANYLLIQGHNPAIIRSGAGDPDEARHKFNDDSTCRHAVVQSATGSEGLTLLGGPGKDRCASSIFYENTYSLGTRIQAEGRNHRYGQDQVVCYYDLVCSPIDRAIIGALQKKTDLVKSVMGAIR